MNDKFCQPLVNREIAGTHLAAEKMGNFSWIRAQNAGLWICAL
ncbi:hypothetical protein B4135_3609 [Caldibacillus debilis]|uniref:Uncharacterized protein n=1 Tax=Caldibacillus debilis TaxID=301148 RepID=A0A150LD20_9BACI|nr:hypothetical protein B4135_3609 [Caldibacillus debilis]